jgi:hypothetical protein
VVGFTIITDKDMSNIIPFENIDVEKLSDEYLVEIESFVKECFHEQNERSNGTMPIYMIKEYVNKQISKKFNLTIEKNKEILYEIQMRKIDRELGK